MYGFKLVRVRKNGTFGPLFINKSEIFPLGIWLTAVNHKTVGYKERPGFHGTLQPDAPHLSKTGRCWVKVEIDDYVIWERPKTQGGKWFTANRMKIIEVVDRLSLKC